jgi:L-Ala-D/L-Glu epimerase
MRIVDVEIIPVRPRMARDFATSKSQQASGAGVVRILVKLYTDTGLVGLGEAAPAAAWNWQTSESTIAALHHALTPALIGQDPLAIEQIHRIMNAILPSGSHTPAKAAIDIACFDVAGKHLGMPVYRLLGGTRREHLDVLLWGLGMPEPGAAAELAREREAAGHRLIKIKVGSDPRRDVQRVAAVRETLSPDTLVTADANEGYTPGDAVRVCAELRPYDVLCLEQPLVRWDLAGMARLRSTTSVPIMADESVMSAADMVAVLRHSAADYLFLKLDNLGGIHPARQVAAMARAGNVVPIAGGSLNTGVGAIALAHLAVALDLSLPGGFNGPLLMEHPLIVDGGALYENGGGVLRVPEGPGLGVEVDESAIREYRAQATEQSSVTPRGEERHETR